MTADEMPEIDLTVSPDDLGDIPEIEMKVSEDELGEIDLTPVLLRRFAWDIMPCSEVNDLLPALGLTHGTDEGMHIDHAESHHRMAQVFPLEMYLQRFAEVMGVVTATAMHSRVANAQEVDTVQFAEQNAEVILHSARAIIAQFVANGVLTYGPRVVFTGMGAESE